MGIRVLSAAALLLNLCFPAPGTAAAAPQSRQGTSSRTSADPSPAMFGTVSGHVYLAGSNAPARLVNVNLQPLQVQEDAAVFSDQRPPLTVAVYQTGLDGSYTIPHVAPGLYYVVVQAPGYLSPFDEFANDDLRRPSPAVAKRMAAELPVITVRPNATSLHDVQLQRGAEMEGSVRFDDGTPFPGAILLIRRRGVAGRWIAVDTYSDRPRIDIDGHWRRTGLIAGEYRVGVRLELNDRKQSSGLPSNSHSSSYTVYQMDFYLGDTSHAADAKLTTLREGERATGLDLTIPVARLHALSGAVLDKTTGQALNAGKLRLVFAADGEQLAQTEIDPETQTFSFPFVPEGEYRLLVDNPRQVRFGTPLEGQGDPNFPNRGRRETILARYGHAELPVLVQTDTANLNVPVRALEQDAR